MAMLAKQAWRLMNNSNPLVTSILKARYYPKTDFVNASMGSSPSYMWHSILESQSVISEGCRKRIGNGEDTRIWKVSWFPCLENGYLTTEIYSELEEATVHGLMNEDKIGWDEAVLLDLCNDRDRKLIQQIPIPICKKPDSWYWALEDNGFFSVKSCCRRLHGELECVNKKVWKRIRELKLPGKVTTLLWRAMRGVLPTATALRSKRVSINEICT